MDDRRPPRRADLLHEKGRLLSDELLRDEAGLDGVREALDASPGHAAATESLAQMALVRANWEPISEALPAAGRRREGRRRSASSLYGSVAEFHLKYRPGRRARAETYLRKSLELDPHNRRSGGHFERLLRDKGAQRRAADAVRAARRSRRQPRRTRAGRGRGRRAVRKDRARAIDAYTHFRKALDANPIEPRALRAVRDALTAPEGVGGAGQGAGGRGAQQARRAGRRRC